MSRFFLATIITAALVLSAGCNPRVEGKGQLYTPTTGVVLVQGLDTAGRTEIELVEKMMLHRGEYKVALETLSQYYRSTGNSLKLNWVESELNGFVRIPQYRYLIEAEVAGPFLQASRQIPAADALYQDAMDHFERGKGIMHVNHGVLRVALDKFNQLIARYPDSDKIDAAAFTAGQIYEEFKDYTIAALYYTRAFQWNNETEYPARFRAAYMNDRHLRDRAKALELYQQSLEKGAGTLQYRQYAEKRIAEITKSE